MDKKKKRPVYFEYHQYIPPEKRTKENPESNKKVEGKGIFHLFGTNIEESEQGFAEQTMAIVEDESGSVHFIYPTFIKFLDK